MKKYLPVTLVAVSAILAVAGLVRADNAVYSCTDANGVESLTNVPNAGNCKQLFSYTPPAPAAIAAPMVPVAPAAPARDDSNSAIGSAAAVPAAAPVDRVSRKPALVNGQPPIVQPRTPLEQLLAQRRAAAIEQTRVAYSSEMPPAGMNRAVNRRYLMTNRAAYQKAIGVMQD